jgi:membrane protein DedA with SNARE-associated domain
MFEEIIFNWVSHYGYAMIFFSLVLGIVGLPVPDETLLTFVGYLTYRGDLEIIPSFLAAFLGSLSGITISYVLGRTGGVHLIRKYGRLLHMGENRVNRIHAWFGRFGRWTLVIGYFIPGVRHLTAFVAGTYRVPYSVFSLFAYTGGFIWSSSFISAGYFGGKGWSRLQGQVHGIFLISFVVILSLIFLSYLWRKRSKRHFIDQ